MQLKKVVFINLSTSLSAWFTPVCLSVYVPPKKVCHLSKNNSFSVYLSVHKVRLCFCSSVHLSFNGVQSFICMFVQGFFDVWKICIKVPSVCLSVCLSVFCLVFLDVWKIFYRIWAWQKEASSVKELEEGETKRNETKVKKKSIGMQIWQIRIIAHKA